MLGAASSAPTEKHSRPGADDLRAGSLLNPRALVENCNIIGFKNKETRMSHIFISYASEDRDFAKRVCDALEKGGYKTWFDVNNIKGKFDFALEQGIKTAQALVFLASPASCQENCWARDELVFARDQEIPIIPVFYRTRELPITILRENAIDYYGEFTRKSLDERKPITFDEMFSALIERIEAVTPRTRSFTFEQPQDRAMELFLAAKKLIQLGYYQEAFNRISLGERICPSDYQDLLGDILFMKEQIAQALKAQYEKEMDEIEQRLTSLESDEYAHWSVYGEKGTRDFYGILRFALLLEADGFHPQAIEQLRRAYKLEPRLTNKKWMMLHFEWSEEFNEILGRILK
jgi:tetratricopeptide (TPR) repeat protein